MRRYRFEIILVVGLLLLSTVLLELHSGSRHPVEIILGAGLLSLFAVFVTLHGGSRLSDTEVDGCLRELDESLPKELEDRDELLSRLRVWAETDDGKPVYMLNLMRFYEHLQEFPGAPTGVTPQAANAHYEEAAMPMLFRRSGYPIFAGNAAAVAAVGKRGSNLMMYDESVDSWDRVLLVRYPDRRAFLQLLADPKYLKIMPYKLAALKVALVPLQGELQLPDLRWLVGCIVLLIFLSMGWFLGL